MAYLRNSTSKNNLSSQLGREGTATNYKGTEVGNENCILRMVKEAKITNMCNSTWDSFQEISVQHFSGHGHMGLLLPLSSGMSGKRKDCWVLENRLNTWMGRKPKVLQEMVPTLPTYWHLHIPPSHAPGPQSFPDIRNQPEQSELKLNQQHKGRTDPKDLTPHNPCLAAIN